MIKDKINYPQYRKYSNNQSYFKIISAHEFEEIKVTGKKNEFHHFIASILPDRNYIYDLTFDYEKYWIKCDPKEYEDLKISIQ